MAGGEDTHARELDQTPTWAVSIVCAVIVIISILLEKVLHRVGEWFTKRHKMALYEALEKVKAELMVLGFISLLLTFGQSYIARICIPLKFADTMLPCPNTTKHKHEGTQEKGEPHRRLLWNEHRFLAGGGGPVKCKPGYEPLISVNGLHQLHIFIFFLAVFHVIYSAITMMLGRLKIRGWKEWERGTSSLDYEFSNDPSRFRLTHETSFVKAHTSFWLKTPFFFYFVCFFRQFFRSVRKADYLAMRHGFVTVHLAPGSKFDFQKYIKRSLEDDFKVVVGISPVLWASVVFFLLLNVERWQALFWDSIIPVVVILAVGTKLQSIIIQMALEIQERHAVVQGIPLVKVSDKHFWFSRPKLVLFLIHFVLFQNAFQITHILWIWYEFGMNSCFHEDVSLVIVRIALGVGVQVLCSYIILPLYALVTQMGSTMKKSIFDDQTNKALKKWHMTAVKKKNEVKAGHSPTASPLQSPVPQFKTTGPSPYSDHEVSKMEVETSPKSSAANLIADVDNGGPRSGTREQQHRDGERRNGDDLPFGKVDLLS
ncbi:MLO-like protein 9 [Telopea speciosissima]|uniref:MLO-like protein 9 n=1 Tax=Telopea speciosissima TaxID=54955 RepID=UPI001CC69EB0|nr:MLO-like protein 9 [Telopea speciosissima]